MRAYPGLDPSERLSAPTENAGILLGTHYLTDIDSSHELRLKGIRAYIRFSQEQPGFFRPMFLCNFHSEFKQPLPKELKDELDSGGNACLKLVSETIEEGIRKGHFRPVSACLTTMACWAALNGTVMLALNDPHRVGGCLEWVVSFGNSGLVVPVLSLLVSLDSGIVPMARAQNQGGGAYA